MSHGWKDSGKIAVGDRKTNRTENPDKPANDMRKRQNDRQGKEINQKDESPQDTIFESVFYIHVL